MTIFKPVSTAAKRTALVKQIDELAEKHGARCEHTILKALPHSIRCRIYLGNYSVGMCFDGKSHVEGFIGHWNTDGDATFPPSFPAHSINQYHRRKATIVCGDFGSFLTWLEMGLQEVSEIQKEVSEELLTF
jgi:hypothetical protein